LIVVDAVEREERVIGFDVRISGAADWAAERRATYLLRSDATPCSLDPTVWPSLFDEGSIARPAWVGPFQNLWEELPALQEFLAGARPKQEAQLTAFTIHASGGGLSEFLDTHVGRSPTTGQCSPFPLTMPAARSAAWRLLGYDVCDLWGLSGLSNCGYDASELAGLRQTWASQLNDRHLFSNLDVGEAFSRLSNVRAPEHAPFFVYGIWSID
jgi:hypothetical protein